MIQSSAAKYRQFGQAASGAADRITAMDTSQFIGPEGDQFREKLNSNMPPHLRITGEAFTKVAQALRGFASTLTDLQGHMRPVAGQAPGAWQRMQDAKTQLADARAADQRHETAQQQAVQHHEKAVAEAKAADKPLPSAPSSNYQTQTPGAQVELNAAQAEWDALVHKANGLRTEMSAATDTCCKAINVAKEMRFKEPPGTFDLIGKAENFITEHKDVLKKISGALKVVSAACTAIGLALQAIPVVGNAVGAAFLTAAAVTGGAALAIDIGIYAATGEGSLTSIVIDTALTVIPIGRLAKVGKRVFSTAAKSGDDVAAVSDDAAKAADDYLRTDVKFPYQTQLIDSFRGEQIPGNNIWPGGKAVTYLDDAQRQQFRLHVDDQGLLRQADGQLFDTSQGVSVWSQNPRAIFVMDKQGNIYASNYHKPAEFHHSSFLSGDPVATAGELQVDRGIVKAINNQSGHYRPDKSTTETFKQYLFGERGATLEGNPIFDTIG